jgi:hypothetical protein
MSIATQTQTDALVEPLFGAAIGHDFWRCYRLHP